MIGALVIAAVFAGAAAARSTDADAASFGGEAESSASALQQKLVDNLQRSVYSMDVEIAMLEDRLENAPIYQIDPRREFVSTAEYVLRQEDADRVHTLDALIGAYTHALCEGDYLDELAAELGTKRSFLSELISLETIPGSAAEQSVEGEEELRVNVSYYSVSAAAQERAVVLLKVIAPDRTTADRIARAARGELESVSETLSRQVLTHSVELLSTQLYVDADLRLAAERNEVYDRWQELRELRENRSQMLSSARSSLASTHAVEALPGGARSVVKNVVLGLALGGFLMLLYWCVRLLLGRRLESADQFYSRYCLNRLGALPPQKKRPGRRFCALDRWTLSHIGDDPAPSEEQCLALAAANVAAYAESGKRLLITGCATPEKLREVGEKLRALLPRYKITVAPDFQSDVNALAVLTETDGVILCEERHVSRFGQINRELTALTALGKPIVGSIIL